jgi:hypothetical protein
MTGVASELEILRAIKTGGVPARDVMLVFTDGEEAGLLGATAFFADHPLAPHVGFILNLESRGGGGRASMFETGADNGGAIDLYKRTAVKPDANSLSVFLYKHLPNDTDYTVAKAKGIPGLNYAFIGRQFDYHSPSSTVQVLDQGSVQHIGEQVLGTARAIAFSPTLPPKAPDAVYGQLPGGFLLVYPAWGGWLLLAGIAGLLAVAIWRAQRVEPWSWLSAAQGAGTGLLILIGGATVLHLTRHTTGYGFGWIAGRPLLARFAIYEVAIALAGLGAVMLIAVAAARGPVRRVAALLFALAGAASSVFGGFDAVGLGEGVAAAMLALIVLGRPAGLFSSWLGLLITGFLAALALQIWAPTIAHTIAWPLLAGAVCAALTAAPAGRRPIGWSLALVITALAFAWLGSLLHNLLQGLDVPELPALVLWLGTFSAWPLVQPEEGQSRALGFAPGALLTAGGVGVALYLCLASPYSPRYPEVTEPLYVVDHDTGKAWRVSPYKPGPWVEDAVLRADGGVVSQRAMPTFSQPVWAAPAKPVTATAPDVGLTRNPDGTLTLHARADADETLDLALTLGAVGKDATLNGKPAELPTKPNVPIFIRWSASPEGVTLTFKPSGPGALKLGYAAYRPQWPAEAKPLPYRPAALMDWDMYGSTVVTGTLNAQL